MKGTVWYSHPKIKNESRYDMLEKLLLDSFEGGANELEHARA